MTAAFDYVLVGGGLQNALLALALRARRPGARVALVERGASLGGNHTWSFHEGDVPEAAREWVEPLVAHRWSSYDVRFPGLERTLRHAYATIPSARVDGVVRERLAGAPGCEVITGRAAIEVGPRAVRLEDGRTLEGTLVVDARGPGRRETSGGAGFQKFVGLELRLQEGRRPPGPSSWTRPCRSPTASDSSTCCLSPKTASSSRTRTSRTPTSSSARRSASGRSRTPARRGSPLLGRPRGGGRPAPALAGPLPRPEASPLVAGYAGGFFHPVTGYSLPVAVRLASLLASVPPERALGPSSRPSCGDTAPRPASPTSSTG